jgi:hypothetical protein
LSDRRPSPSPASGASAISQAKNGRRAGEIVPPGSGEDRVRVRRRISKRSVWRRRRWWFVGAAGVILVIAVISITRYALAISALQEGRNQALAARQLLVGDLAHLDRQHLQAAQADLQRASDDLGTKSQLLSDGWLAGIAAHLPWLSGQVEGARAIRTAAAAGVALGFDVTQLVESVLPTSTSSSSAPFQRLAALSTQHRSELDRDDRDLAKLRDSLSAISTTDALVGPLASARTSVLRDGGALADGTAPALEILRALPSAIGSGHHTYLVLLENPGEERPGGGYIGAVGVVSFTNGAITTLEFRDSQYYTKIVRNIPAPGPLDKHLFHGAPWELADANWSPDFPTSMADVERFYTAATHSSVDGDISIDPVALSYLLAVFGPVTVPPYPQVITAGNILTELNYVTNHARPQDPGKVFLAPFGTLMTKDLLGAPVGSMPRLANALARGAKEKHLVLFFHDKRLQSVVDGASFSGRLATPVSDSVLVDDANLSGTKGDLYVKRDMSLTVRVGSDGNAQDQLALHYVNPRPTAAADKALLTQSGGDYRDYVRVYIPETAQLNSLSLSVNGGAASSIAPEEIDYTLGHEAIAYWLIVPAGGSATLTIRYAGPFADISVTPEAYQVLWVKQINALTWPVDVTVAMPGNKAYHWHSELSEDQSWSAQGAG